MCRAGKRGVESGGGGGGGLGRREGEGGFVDFLVFSRACMSGG